MQREGVEQMKPTHMRAKTPVEQLKPEEVKDLALEDAIVHTEKTVEILNALHNQMELSASTLIPLIRKYLEEVRSIRMAYSHEVVHIIEAARQLNEIAKNTDKIKELGLNIALLNRVLDTGTIERLQRLFPRIEGAE